MHRTGQGFVVGSQWSVEYDGSRAPWLKFRSAPDAACTASNEGRGTAAADDDKSAEDLALSGKPAPGKPELLPWRTRLKGYRLGARIFHGR
jgi:hypothetical protein